MNNKDLARVGPWIKNAYALTFSNLSLWTGVTILYLVLVALVSGLPFVGTVLLVFFTPVIAAGALKEAANPHPTKTLFARATDILLGVLRDRELSLAVMSVATILLGAWVFLSVVAMLFGVDSFSLIQLFAHRSPVAGAFTAILLLIFWGLQVGLVMTALYVLAGIVLSAQKPVDALEHTIRLWRTHTTPIGVLGSLLVLPLIIASYSRPWIQTLVAIATLVPLTLAIYISYGTLPMGASKPSPLER